MVAGEGRPTRVGHVDVTVTARPLQLMQCFQVVRIAHFFF